MNIKKLEKYKITLYTKGMESSFYCDDPTHTETAWKENIKLKVIESNGKKRCFYDLSKYHAMIIEEMMKE